MDVRFLCQEIFGGITRSHRVAVIRSVKQLAKGGYPIAWMESEGRGGPLIFYRVDSAIATKEAKRLCQSK